MKEIDGSLLLFSTRNIQEGEELLYDYGLTHYPWKEVKSKKYECSVPPLQMNSVTSPTINNVKATEKRSPVVLLSSCSDEEKKRLQKMADNLKVQLCHEFSPSVTHLLMKTYSRDDRKCDRTWKYFQAIANKLWVLNTQWLEKSAEEGVLLSEVDYEINADTVTDSIYNGPQKSRTCSSLLLADFSFILSGFSGYDEVPYGDLVALITWCGGSIVDRFQCVSKNNIVLIPDCEDILVEKNVSSGCTMVVLAWLFDTIATYSIQPLKDYTKERKQSDSFNGLDRFNVTSNDDEFTTDVIDSALYTEKNVSTLDTSGKDSTPNSTTHKEAIDGKNDDYAPSTRDSEDLRDGEDDDYVPSTRDSEDLRDGENDDYVPSTRDSEDLRDGENDDYVPSTRDSEDLRDGENDDLPLTRDSEDDDLPLTRDNEDDDYVPSTRDNEDDSAPSTRDNEDLRDGENDDLPSTRDSEDDDYVPSTIDSEDDDYVPSTRDIEDLRDSEDDDYEPSTRDSEDDDSAPSTIDSEDDDHVPSAIDSEDTNSTTPKTAYTNFTQDYEGGDNHAPMDAEDSEILPDTDSEEKDDDCSTVFGDVLQVAGIKIQKSKNEMKREQKLQCCVFCETLMTKVSRHMERKHHNEKEVAQILLLPKKSKERKQGWQGLISKGNYSHNIAVLKQGKGTIIPKYRPRKGDLKEKDDYLPCSNCFAFIVTTDLWKHQKSCPATNKLSHYKGESIYNGKLLIPSSCSTYRKLYENVILKMRDDEISSCIRKDTLIIEFGERCFEKLGHHLQNHQYIAQRMRELSRLLMVMENINSSVKKLADCLEPENWKSLLQGVKQVSGFIEDQGKYEIPSLALKLGHSLSKCARIIRNQGAVEQNTIKQQKAESFLNLYKDEWSDRISSMALETLHTAKFNKPKLLPTVEDVNKLHKYLENEAEALITEKDKSKYVDLAEVCIVQIILFNRKRSGEVERIKIEQYNALKKSSEVDVELTKALTKFERALIANHKRIEIRGKKGGKVPVLFTNNMERNVNILLDMRKELGIVSEYLFAKQGSRFPIRGTDAMRKIANKCGSKLPDLLKSTNLRKQLATMSQLLNLSTNDQDMLAKFMGHDLQICKEYYRLPQSTLEVAKVSKVLHAINEGRIMELKDQTFNEMQLQDEELELESSLSDEENDKENTRTKSATVDDADFLDSTDGSSDDLENVSLKDQVRKRKKNSIIKKSWSTEEQLAVQRTLGKYLRLKSLPGKTECLAAISKEPVLKNRKWEHVKHYIRNRNISKKRQ